MAPPAPPSPTSHALAPFTRWPCASSPLTNPTPSVMSPASVPSFSRLTRLTLPQACARLVRRPSIGRIERLQHHRQECRTALERQPHGIGADRGEDLAHHRGRAQLADRIADRAVYA